MIELEGEIQKAGRYTRGVRQNFDRLLGRKSKGSDKPNLKAVPPSRYVNQNYLLSFGNIFVFMGFFFGQISSA